MPLSAGHDFDHGAITGLGLGSDVDLRSGLLVAHAIQAGLQLCAALEHFAVPRHRVVVIDVDLDDLGLYVLGYWWGHRHVQVDRMQLCGNGDDQHDDQHQEDINQGGGVDVHHDLGFGMMRRLEGHFALGAQCLGFKGVGEHGVHCLRGLGDFFSLGLCDKAHFGHAKALQGIHHTPNGLKVSLFVSSDLNLGLGGL